MILNHDKLKEIFEIMPKEEKEKITITLKDYEGAKSLERGRLDMILFDQLEELVPESPKKEWEYKIMGFLYDIEDEKLMNIKKEEEKEKFKNKNYASYYAEKEKDKHLEKNIKKRA